MHPLVEQLKFARSEFLRVFDGVDDEDGRTRLQPMNCLGWIMAHLALQEQRYWVRLAQGRDAIRHPELLGISGYPDRATKPDLSVVRPIWNGVTSNADTFLDGADQDRLLEHFVLDGEPVAENIGTMLLRNIYHYWFHTGEAHAIRQQLGHKDLPDFVGNLGSAPYHDW
ncbi:MAG: DinB family protein [Thermomicrobiales bacterium]